MPGRPLVSIAAAPQSEAVPTADAARFERWRESVEALRTSPEPTREACLESIGEFLKLEKDGLLRAVVPADFAESMQRLRTSAGRALNPSTTAYLALRGAGALQDMGASRLAKDMLVAMTPDELASQYGRPSREMIVQLHRELGEHDDARRLLAELAASCPADDFDSRAAIEGIHFEIYARTGILDEAARALAREREAAAHAQGLSAEPMAYLHGIELQLARGDHEYALTLASDFEERFATRELRADLRAIAKLYAAIAVFGIEHSSEQRPEVSSQHSLAAAAQVAALPIALRRLAELKRFEAAIHGRDVEAATQMRDVAIHAIEDPERPIDPIRESHVRALDVRFQRLVGAPSAVRETARSALRQALERRVAAWEIDAKRVGGSGFLHHDDDRALVGELVDAWLLDSVPSDDTLDAAGLASWRAQRGLEVLLWIQELNSLARARRAGPCSVDALRRELRRPGHGVLCYFPWRIKTHLFVVDDEGVSYVPLPARLRLAHEARAFADELATYPTAPSAGAEAFGQRLLARAVRVRDLVLPEPVEARMRSWRGVTIMGAELLHDLPFAALPLRGDGVRLLGEELPVDALSSAPLGLRLLRDLREQAPLPTQQRLSLSLLACTTSTLANAETANFENLAFPRQRAIERIAAGYAVDARRMLFDRDWTRAAWRRVSSKSSDVLQIIAHSIDHPGQELSKGLAIGDGALWYEDVLAHAHPRGLVLLSACSASNSAPRAGDSTLATNLGGAFLRTGSRAVALSSIPVELYDHLDFLAIAHRQLTADASIATAFCAARASAKRASIVDRLARATFTIHGLGQYPVRIRRD